MTDKEIAKELTIAVIPKINAELGISGNPTKNSALAEEVAKVYRIIYETVKQD